MYECIYIYTHIGVSGNRYNLKDCGHAKRDNFLMFLKSNVLLYFGLQSVVYLENIVAVDSFLSCTPHLPCRRVQLSKMYIHLWMIKLYNVE